MKKTNKAGVKINQRTGEVKTRHSAASYDEEAAIMGLPDYAPTPIKIPKLKPGMYPVRIYRTITVPTLNMKKKLLVTMKAQSIEGIEFPQREVYIDDFRSRTSDSVDMSHTELNEIIKLLTFEALRTVKKS